MNEVGLFRELQGSDPCGKIQRKNGGFFYAIYKGETLVESYRFIDLNRLVIKQMTTARPKVRRQRLTPEVISR